MTTKLGSHRNRAVVIGGSMSGLLAARVLTDFYENVIVLERDELADNGEQRRGVPHGRHAHAILAGGLQVIEELFPGISAELLAKGALACDALNDGRWFFEGGDLARCPSGTESILASRPFLEDGIRRRVRGLMGLTVRDKQSVRGLIFDDGCVTGVETDDGTIEADLVVDASGRGSLTPKWLDSMGYPTPRQERVEVQLTYTTRIFRRHSHQMNGDVFVVIPPTPEGKRGGVALAKENDEWIVTLFGHFGNKAPEDLEGYIDYARSLPAQYVHELLTEAEPVGDAAVFNFPASVRRRYEDLARVPDGLLVFGDAICSFDPVYGQGMSSAALQAKELCTALANDGDDLARRFYGNAAKVIDNPWSIAVGSDLKMKETPGPRSLPVKLINWYMSKLHRCGHNNTDASIAFIRVAQLLDPPPTLMRPSMAARVLWSGVRQVLGIGRDTGALSMTDAGPSQEWRSDGF